MRSPESSVGLHERIQAGDPAVATEIVARFTRQLVGLARQRLDACIRRKIEPDEIVQSVYRSFFRQCREGGLFIDDWNGLWGLLSLMTVRKCADKAGYFLAGCRDLRREADLLPEAENIRLLAREPTPHEVVVFTELLGLLLADLEPMDRSVVNLYLQGCTLLEICNETGCTHRTSRRILARARQRLLRLQSSGGEQNPA